MAVVRVLLLQRIICVTAMQVCGFSKAIGMCRQNGKPCVNGSYESITAAENYTCNWDAGIGNVVYT